jgi:hypothetical protein
MEKIGEERKNKINASKKTESENVRSARKSTTEKSRGDVPLVSIFFVGMFIILLGLLLFHLNGLS